MKNPSSKSEPNSRWFILVTALGVALSTSFLDVALAVLPRPARLASIGFLGISLVAAVCAVFVVYLVLWFGLGYTATRRSRIRTVPAGLSLAFLLATFLTLGKMVGWSLDPNNLLRLAVVGFVSLVVLVGAYVGALIAESAPAWKRVATAFLCALPLLLAETMVFAWLQVYRIGAFTSLSSMLLATAYLIVVVSTLGLFYRSGWTASRSVVVLAAIVFLSPVAWLLEGRESAAPPGGFTTTQHRFKHVFLITIDTLRRDALSCYGSTGVQTPHIDDLAKDSVVFTNAHSTAPWTLPSTSSIMSGLAPSVHLALGLHSRLSDNATTLAERMRDAGYYTGAIGNNAVLTPEFNVSQGFLEYDFHPKAQFGNSLGESILRRFFPKKFTVFISTPGLTDKSIDWIERHAGEDFLLWLHYFDPHQPYAPPEQFQPAMKRPRGMRDHFTIPGRFRVQIDRVPTFNERDWIKALYEGEVALVDANVGRLFEALRRLGLYDDALIVLTSDHGEEFWDHGGFEHAHTLYRELLDVPLLIKLPGSSARTRVAEPVSTQSIAPTIADLCEIDTGDEDLGATTLSPLWSKPGAYEGRPLASTGVLYYEQQQAVIFDGFKYIRHLITDREELYDLSADPQELHSIASSNPQRLEKARALLDKHNEFSAALRERLGLRGEHIDYKSDTVEKLKSLGYM